jgi:hypothetical protein
MRKFLSVCGLLLLTALHTVAQSPDYRDLLNLFVDEKYPKLLQKAEGYTLDEKTKKDPLPYLFMSMGFYKVSLRDEYKEKYPNSFQSSLKYLSKYAKYDKDKTMGAEYEDFFIEIRKAVISEAEVMNDQQKYTKSKTLYKNLIDLDPNDAGAYIMQGMTFTAMKSKKEAEVAFKTAKELISSGKCSVTDKDQKNFLKNALIEYAGSLSTAGQKSAAKEWMDLGMKYFEGDKEYQVNYESVGG